MHPNLIRKAGARSRRIDQYSVGKTTVFTDDYGVDFCLFIGEDGRMWRKMVIPTANSLTRLWMPAHDAKPFDPDSTTMHRDRG